MHGNSLPPGKGILRVSMIMILIAFIGYFPAFSHKFSNISRHSCRLYMIINTKSRLRSDQFKIQLRLSRDGGEIELRSIQDPVEIKSRSR